MGKFRDGSGGEDDWLDEQPVSEVVVIDDDGPAEPVRGAGPRPRGIAMRFGLVLAAVALFAAGVVLGRGSVTTQSGLAQPDPAATVTTSTPPAETPGITVTLSPDDVVTTWGLLPSGPAWPTATGLCGVANLMPFVDGARPLTEPVDLRFVTGGNPATVDLAAGTVSAPLFTAGSPHYVADLASDPMGIVVLMSHCDDESAFKHVIRVSPYGESEIPLTADTSRARLISGGNRVWVELPPEGAYGYNPIMLAAADLTGASVTLPAGLIPLGVYGGQGPTDLIVGQYRFGRGGLPSDSFAMVNTATGEVVREFGPGDRDTDTIRESDVVNAQMSGRFVISAPWSCEETCPLHRYDLVTGVESSVGLHPAADRLLSGLTVAISPSGGLAAVELYDQPASPAPFDPSRRSDGTQLARIGLIDLDDGSVRALPGITLGSEQSPALTFSPDGRWLVVAIADGDSTRLLLYTADGDGPYDPGLTVPGPVDSPLIAPSPN